MHALGRLLPTALALKPQGWGINILIITRDVMQAAQGVEYGVSEASVSGILRFRLLLAVRSV